MTDEENNALLLREAAADAAVQIVLKQVGLEHPTLLSTWTRMEIARLLHLLHTEPGGEIVLGEQTLSGGFGTVKKPTKLADIPLTRTSPVVLDTL